MTPRDNSNRLTGRGRRLLTLSGFILLMAGVFALFLGVTGRFLPHDERFLEMTADQLCSLHACRIVHFMIHDRVSFGGALVCIGVLYIWLAESPLKQGEAWGWWVLVLSGVVGFGSFFAYLGYGYLDTWHGIATLGLLPCFVLGLVHTPESRPSSIRSLLTPSVCWRWNSPAGFGMLCLLGTAVGLACGGLTILVVGTTWVFVPQDLSYMGLSVAELDALNPRLVPLIAHDRAGFGGAVCCCGIALFFCIWCGRPTRGLGVGFQYHGNKCRLACDFRFFELARLESLPSRTQRQTELLDRYLRHYEDVHSGFEQAKQHYLTHGALHAREQAPPFSEADRLELLKSLGGQSKQYSCNWAASDDMPLTRHSDYHSVPRTADGRDLVFVGELSTPHYVWSNKYALGCELLLFYDPVSRVSLSTFDWS